MATVNYLRSIFSLGAAAIVISLPACGGGGGGGGTNPTNQPPTGSFTVSPDTPALMGATSVTFSATGSDPEGDPLTFAWDFGDGQSGSGLTTQHVFVSAGTMRVVLTVRDSKGAQITATGNVTVRSITGVWVDVDPRFRWEFSHTGSTFTGTMTASGFGQVSAAQNATVSHPRNVSFRRVSSNPGFYTGDYSGTLDASLDNMFLQSTPQFTFNLRRQ